MSNPIRAKDRDAVIQSLRAGVVPRAGQHLIQVGRIREVETLVSDIDRLADGGSSFRLVVGEYGAGKTFFLNLVRAIAMERKLVVASADLNPDRRLHASGGQARSLYAELMRNLATRTKPDGGALPGVVEKFIATAKTEAKAKDVPTEQVIRAKLEQLTELVNGYDFAEVIAAYCKGFEQGNEQLKSDAIRWLRGEFSTKTDAKAALGVRSIVDDASVYDQLKLMGRFVRLAGFSGLLVCLDELVNLYKLANAQARNSNYEQILRMLNDSFQGTAVGLGFVLGGTPEFLMDPRRGVYSYQALQSRLAQNTFAKEGLVDFSGPVVRLSSLTAEDFYVLLTKIRHVYAGGDADNYLLPDEAVSQFMEHCANRIGDSFFRTPRTTITAFINLLAVLEQNPGTAWQTLIGEVEVKEDHGGDEDLTVQADDKLASFKL
ncbi:ATP-binding protein [Xanthomonas hortorum pv. pelargonii]|uniref:ATP-binding protein n=5 Tax=Xanthomonas hortorum TaxID=56454 RepID=A0A6V7CCQ9_9XANT|nr:ATP-binding protein [Xanthomonas hortorum]MCE4356282.1 ATP-binding protein [Xanthomonas hortorum pv. pelargonii]MCU1706528.1 ATP-binding protein [Xanthomonas hortorum pv. pelargonii]MCU1710851.1 ATP-binding protein [Xanthomonas hortorum pv. pelargonii]MCU1715110.1 ATP-binding protein [Xanthomonas hortorum pv. pelargonii]NMI24227.1 ATP-binding protein [Xanthomonas hortorum pv. pelargonii]